MTHDDLMQVAIEQARLGLAAREVPIGAVLAVGDRIVARAFNRPIAEPGACDLSRIIFL